MNKYTRKLAMILALILVMSSMPYTAKAASAPDFKLYRTNLYENTAAKGVYTYTIVNVKKGYKVKWSLSGTGKAYGKLKYAETTAKGTTSSNKITINSNKETAAKNKKITLTAIVYDGNNKLVKTLKNEVTIKIQATAIAFKTTKIKDDLNSLSIGTSYDFDKTFTPANSTSKTYWTVKDENGKDRSSEITSAGIWKPTTAGKFTITVTARNSKNGKDLASKSISVEVGVSITDLKQTAANQFRVIFSKDMSNNISADDFTITAVNGTSTIAAKEVSCSSSGKVVTVTNYSNFKDGVSYHVTYGNITKAFIASVGEPKTVKILTNTVEANKAADIEYGIYDSKDIEVSAAVLGSGKVNFEAEVTNGYLTDDNKIFMTTPGKTAKVIMTYTDDKNNTLSATKTITCVEPKATEVNSESFTITNSKSQPDYDSSSYKANTTIAIGDTAYAHFRALDGEKKVISYSSVKYSSSDDDKLIVDSDGKLTPIKSGTVKIVVTATEDGKDSTFAYTVTIIAKRVPSYARLSTSSVTMSSVYVTNYEEYIDVEIFDQHNVSLDLENASCTIKESGNKVILASYDDVNRRIVVKAQGAAAGTYTYTATFVLSGTTVTASFAVVVKTVPSSGSYGYTPVIDYPDFDMVIDSSTFGDKNITVRLKQMLSGVFSGYAGCVSATIKKDGLYYGNDLTAGGSKNEISAVITNATDIVLTPLSITQTGASVGESKKAEKGIYTITLKYYNSNGILTTAGINLTLKDTQSLPSCTIKSTTSSKTVNTALALVNECIALSDGTIYNCTVTGSSSEGDSISVTPGQKINVSTISIRRVMDISGGKRVYVYDTINIGRTFTNRA